MDLVYSIVENVREPSPLATLARPQTSAHITRCARAFPSTEIDAVIELNGRGARCVVAIVVARIIRQYRVSGRNGSQGDDRST